MNVRDMHIEINQSLQQVAANRTRKYLSEEIDWVLNKQQDRFIQSCLRPVNMSQPELMKFRFADQIRADALRYLLVVNKELECTKKDASCVQAILPPDYQYLMTDASNMVNLCGDTRTEDTETRLFHTLQLSKSSLPAGPYYLTGNTIQVGAVILQIPGSLPMYNTYQGYTTKEDVVFLKEWILAQLWKQGVEVYWEKFGSFYRPNCFIFPGAQPNPLTITWDSVNSTLVNSESYDVVVQSRSSTATVTTDNRLLSPYDVTSIYTPYYAPSIKSPASELSGNSLIVYQDENTTVKSVFISYIRKPQPISLSLDSSCEIAEQFHQTICDLSTEYILGQLKDQTGKQAKTQDNETRIIL